MFSPECALAPAAEYRPDLRTLGASDLAASRDRRDRLPLTRLAERRRVRVRAPRDAAVRSRCTSGPAWR